MRHYYTTLAKAKSVSRLTSKAESAIYEIVGYGFLVGRTALREEYKYAADMERGIYVRQHTDTDGNIV